MSTRAYIGIKNEDGTVSAIYNHSDGGLDNLGDILKNHFKTEESVRELVGLGFISSIQELETYEYCKNTFHSFDESEWKDLQTVSGLKIHAMPVGGPAEKLNNIEDVMGSMIAHAYLFEPKENMWYYTKGKGLKPLNRKKVIDEKAGSNGIDALIQKKQKEVAQQCRQNSTQPETVKNDSFGRE